MALVDPEKVEDIKAKVTEEYLKAFPELEGRYSAYVCESADGVRLQQIDIYAIKETKVRILSEAGSCITCLIICDRICQTVKKKRKETCWIQKKYHICTIMEQ